MISFISRFLKARTEKAQIKKARTNSYFNTFASKSLASKSLSATGVRKVRRTGLIGGFCLGLLWPIVQAAPAKAAERVTLTYGFAEISTTVEALKQYAETGEVDRTLRPYLRFLNDAQQDQFRQTLQVRSDTSAVQISQFLYSAIGENILRSIGGIIQTQGRRDGAKGLRGAIVLAAAEPEGLSLLGVLEQFPTDNVRIDSQEAFRVFGSFTQLVQDTERAIAAISSQSEPPSLFVSGVPALDALSQPGPYAVTVQSLSVVDRERDRTLPTDLYLPTDAPPAGIIALSHGLAGDRKGFAAVSEHLASYGYAVAALDHPGSNTEQLYSLLRGTEQEVADPSEFSDRPKDVSFLLDELTRLNEGNGALAGKLDPSRVGIIGHSFGGYTALALSGAKLDFDTLQANCESDAFIFNGANPSMLLQCTALLEPAQFNEDLRDERIQAVIALNPVTSSLFGPEGFAEISIPSLIVAGTSDPVAPALLEQIRPFTWLNEADVTPETAEETETTEETETNDETDASDETKANPESEPAADHYLALIQGGSHLYDPPEVEGADRIALADQLVNADTQLAYTYLKAMSIGFMQAEIDQNAEYQAALDAAAVIQIGQQPLPLYLVTTLTEAMLNPPPAPPTPEVEPDPALEQPPANEAPPGETTPSIAPDEASE
ncbi:MAG: alpha/beta hydrolase [Phormidesmis sp.]